MDKVAFQVIAGMQAAFGNGILIDISSAFCDPAGSCKTFTEDGELISYDGAHLTPEGARYLSGRLLQDPLFRQAINGREL